MKRSLKIIIVVLIISITFVLSIKGGYVPYLSEPDPFLPEDVPESTEPKNCSVYNEIFMYIPAAELLTHEIFSVDTSFYNVILSYKASLISEGYSVYSYNGSELIGNVTLGENILSYGAFIKGITVVVVLSTDSEGKSCVLFTTGAIWEYQPIIEDLSKYI
jgi:hypothetical protein